MRDDIRSGFDRFQEAQNLTGRLVSVLLFGTGAIVSLAGCGEPSEPPPPPPAPVAAIILDPVTATLVPDETVQLTAMVKDASGNSLNDRMISWSSSVAVVATVSSGGLVTAVSFGAASITGTSEGKSASVAITVKDGRVVTAAGGTVIAQNGVVTLALAAGALTQPTPIAVAPASGLSTDPLLVRGTIFDFQPNGTQFSQPVTLAIKYDPAEIPPGISESTLQLEHDVGGVWVPVTGSVVDLPTHRVTAPIIGFSSYGVGFALPQQPNLRLPVAAPWHWLLSVEAGTPSPTCASTGGVGGKFYGGGYDCFHRGTSQFSLDILDNNQEQGELSGVADVDILAAGDGIVRTVTPNPGNNPGCGCFGNFVVIDHANGFSTLYGHLKDGSILVGDGNSVRQGEKIGIMGNSGESTGIHLHFTVRFNDQGAAASTVLNQTIVDGIRIIDYKVGTVALPTFYPSSNTPILALSVGVAGTGSGNVSSNVGGINCSITAGTASGNCSASFNSGMSVTLTATPASGHSFTGWSENGAQISSSASYTFTTSANRSLVAHFSANPSVPLTGRVYNAVTNANLAGVSIKVTRLGTTVATTQTNAQGTWTVSVPDNNTYGVTASTTGFVTATILAQPVAGPTTALPIPLVPTSTSTGGIAGRLLNATNNAAIAGGTVELRAGINATAGSPLATLTANASGNYTFSNLAAGTYSVRGTAGGFVDGTRTGIAVGGTTVTGQDVVLSPIGVANAVRIVLTWGATPSDLDSHLTGPVPGTTSRFHVYYADKGDCNVSPFACLDVDDRTAFGPETITVTQLFSGTYRYSVQNYSAAFDLGNASDGTLAASNARVDVYVNNALRASFAVPQQLGTLWTVFTMNQAGTVTPVNTISGTPPGTGALRASGSASIGDADLMAAASAGNRKPLRIP